MLDLKKAHLDHTNTVSITKLARYLSELRIMGGNKSSVECNLMDTDLITLEKPILKQGDCSVKTWGM